MKNDIFILVMFVSVFIATISQVLLKLSARRKYSSIIKEYLNAWVILAYTLFFISSLISVFALKYVPLSIAPIIESCGYIMVAVLGYYVLGERLNKKQIMGMCIIFLGIFIAIRK